MLRCVHLYKVEPGLSQIVLGLSQKGGVQGVVFRVCVWGNLIFKTLGLSCGRKVGVGWLGSGTVFEANEGLEGPGSLWDHLISCGWK